MRSSHSFGSAPKATPAPSNSANATTRAPFCWLHAIAANHGASTAPAASRLRSFPRRGWPGPRRIGGHQSEQRHAARQRTGIFTVRDHVVREPRRRHDAGGGTRRRRDVASGSPFEGSHFDCRRRAARDRWRWIVGLEHDGFASPDWPASMSLRIVLGAQPENRHGGDTGGDAGTGDRPRESHPAFGGSRLEFTGGNNDRGCVRWARHRPCRHRKWLPAQPSTALARRRGRAMPRPARRARPRRSLKNETTEPAALRRE